MEDKVVLVDKNDNEVGSMEKLRTHQEGRLHRAISVFIFNRDGRLLLQKRAKSKYHSGGLWSNTCCSHPRPGEVISDAVQRRIQEEMGFCCQTNEIFSTIYKTKLDNNLVEHENDHIFIGEFNGRPQLNYHEVEDWKWIDIDALKKDMKQHHQNYTYWFCLLLDDVMPHLSFSS